VEWLFANWPLLLKGGGLVTIGAVIAWLWRARQDWKAGKHADAKATREDQAEARASYRQHVETLKELRQLDVERSEKQVEGIKQEAHRQRETLEKKLGVEKAVSTVAVAQTQELFVEYKALFNAYKKLDREFGNVIRLIVVSRKAQALLAQRIFNRQKAEFDAALTFAAARVGCGSEELRSFVFGTAKEPPVEYLPDLGVLLALAERHIRQTFHCYQGSILSGLPMLEGAEDPDFELATATRAYLTEYTVGLTFDEIDAFDVDQLKLPD
jgi:hypothetical protein